MTSIKQSIMQGEEIPLNYPPAGAINATTDEPHTIDTTTSEGG